LQVSSLVLYLHPYSYMVVVAQLVRASVCGTEGRRFEPGLPPKALQKCKAFFMRYSQISIFFIHLLKENIHEKDNLVSSCFKFY
jgi:hypothetical protein